MLRRIVARSLLFVIPVTVWTADGAAQTREMKNPLEGQRKAIDQGEFVYKRRCSNCHGLDARGYRAPDLTAGQFVNGTSDAQLYRVITRGIPTTEMSGTNMNEDEVWALISYIRTIMKQGAGYIAKRENEPSVYELDSKAVEELQKTAYQVKEFQPPKPETKKK